jgi:hypothetical protein
MAARLPGLSPLYPPRSSCRRPSAHKTPILEVSTTLQANVAHSYGSRLGTYYVRASQIGLMEADPCLTR